MSQNHLFKLAFIIFFGFHFIGICENKKNIVMSEEIVAYAKKIEVFSIRTVIFSEMPKTYSIVDGRDINQLPIEKEEKKLLLMFKNFIDSIKEGKKYSKEIYYNIDDYLLTENPMERAIILSFLISENRIGVLPIMNKFSKDNNIFIKSKHHLEKHDVYLHISSGYTGDVYKEKKISQLVEEYLELWMNPVGYNAKDFNKYWEERKDLKSFVGWYYVRLVRSRDIETDKPRASVIQKILEDINKLPEPLSTYTLTSIIAEHHKFMSKYSDFNKFLPKEKKLIQRFKKIDKEELKNIFIKEQFCNDPDLKANKNWDTFYHTLLSFVYKNKTDFFNKEDIKYINENSNKSAKKIIKDKNKE